MWRIQPAVDFTDFMIFTETPTAVLTVALWLICLLHFRFSYLFTRDNSVQAFTPLSHIEDSAVFFLLTFTVISSSSSCSVCHFCNLIPFE